MSKQLPSHKIVFLLTIYFIATTESRPAFDLLPIVKTNRRPGMLSELLLILTNPTRKHQQIDGEEKYSDDQDIKYSSGSSSESTPYELNEIYGCIYGCIPRRQVSLDSRPRTPLIRL